jgi:biotin transport system substrate-specific component
MSEVVSQSPRPVFSPLDLQGRSAAWRVGAVVVGTLFLALSSYIEVRWCPCR